MTESGNFVRDDSFISLMLTLRTNIMSTLHVADIVRVISQNADSTYTCCRFDDESKVITCLALENLTISENDICLVLYCDHDFRSNLKKLQANSKIIKKILN